MMDSSDVLRVDMGFYIPETVTVAHIGFHGSMVLLSPDGVQEARFLSCPVW